VEDIDARTYYYFDGTSMYATIPDWTPLGYDYSIEAEAEPLTVDGSVRHVLGGAGHALRISADAWQFRFDDEDGTGRFLSGSPASEQSNVKLKGDGPAGENASLTVNAGKVSSSFVAA
jgi:hypothetical protein